MNKLALYIGLTLLLATTAFGEIQQTSFSITGDNGETGAGYVTWDDTVVSDGEQIFLDGTDNSNILSIGITITGGNVVGGTTSFGLADCDLVGLMSAPDFVRNINCGCDNGTNKLEPWFEFTDELNTISRLTYTPGETIPLVPPLDLVKLKGSWTIIMASGDQDPRYGSIDPAIHLVLNKYTELSPRSQRLEGQVIDFTSNTRISDAVCVNDEDGLYSRADYICTYNHNSIDRYVFINDIDPDTSKYFLGEYMSGNESQAIILNNYNNRLTSVSMGVPKITTIVIPMF